MVIIALLGFNIWHPSERPGHHWCKDSPIRWDWQPGHLLLLRVQVHDLNLSGISSLSEGLDPWRLAAVEQLTYSGKSLLLALALSAGRLTLKEALVAVRLEEIIQSEEWGEVEAGHDLDGADIGSRVASAILMLDLIQLKA